MVLGTVRLIRKSILVATRARKRLAVFVIVYAILAGMVILSIGRLAGYNTTGLVDQRSVVLEATDFDTITYNQAKNDTTTLSHVVFEESVGGRTGTIFTKPGLGDTITIAGGEETKTFKVVGTFEEGQVDDDPGNTWMVVTVDDLWLILNDLLRVYEDQTAVINSVLFCYKIVIVAEGSVFWSAVRGGDVWNNVEGIVEFTETTTLQGNYNSPEYTKKADNQNAVIADMMLITVAFLGGALVASMYAFLITRFRRIEIATLKAIGYTNRNVWTMTLGEILLASIAGFILGLLGIAVYLGVTGETVVIFSRTTLLTAFLIVVLIQVPAFILSNKRTLRIPPAEALRTL